MAGQGHRRRSGCHHTPAASGPGCVPRGNSTRTDQKFKQEVVDLPIGWSNKGPGNWLPRCNAPKVENAVSLTRAEMMQSSMGTSADTERKRVQRATKKIDDLVRQRRAAQKMEPSIAAGTISVHLRHQSTGVPSGFHFSFTEADVQKSPRCFGCIWPRWPRSLLRMSGSHHMSLPAARTRAEAATKELEGTLTC